MAVNPTTGIDRENDRFVIWRVSTQQYTNMHAMWPQIDGNQLVGANPDFEYYKKVAGTPPDYDHRYTLTTTFSRVAITPAPAVGLPQGTYEPEFSLEKLPVADLQLQVLDETKRQFAMRFPQQDSIMELSEVADALARKEAGLTLNAAQQSILDAMLGVGDFVSQLRARQSALNAAIDADEDYDITAGWPS
jgi:hypothetical protein